MHGTHTEESWLVPFLRASYQSLCVSDKWVIGPLYKGALSWTSPALPCSQDTTTGLRNWVPTSAR